jgi:hypothetical protein
MTEPKYLDAIPGDFFCPAGGNWYACETGTKFVGCCLSNPCINHCVGDQLRPAGFSSRVYNQSPGGTCGGVTPFWTCTAGSTFWGCCNKDPCANHAVCPVGQLEPTVMGRPDQLEYFGALNSLMTNATSSASPSATPRTTDASSSGGVSGAVIGGAVGGAVALLAIIGVLIFFLCRRRRRKQSPPGGAEVGGHEGTAVMQQRKGAYAPASPQAGGLSPPPMYSSEQHAYYQGPQELPAEHSGSSAVNRYSELEGQGVMSRFSELPNTGAQPSELESPHASPKPAQMEFVPKQATQSGNGLGVMMGEEGRKR